MTTKYYNVTYVTLRDRVTATVRVRALSPEDAIEKVRNNHRPFSFKSVRELTRR